jgi:hypothetical protein
MAPQAASISLIILSELQLIVAKLGWLFSWTVWGNFQCYCSVLLQYSVVILTVYGPLIDSTVTCWNCFEYFENIEFNCILLFVVCSFYSFELNRSINSKWRVFDDMRLVLRVVLHSVHVPIKYVYIVIQFSSYCHYLTFTCDLLRTFFLVLEVTLAVDLRATCSDACRAGRVSRPDASLSHSVEIWLDTHLIEERNDYVSLFWDEICFIYDIKCVYNYNGQHPWIPENCTRPIVGGETQHDGSIVEE